MGFDLREIVTGAFAGLILMASVGCGQTFHEPRPEITSPPIVKRVIYDAKKYMDKYEETKDSKYLINAFDSFMSMGGYINALGLLDKCREENIDPQIIARMEKEIDPHIPRKSQALYPSSLNK